MATLDPTLYTIAWITPLEIEAQAALHMLDDEHRGKFPVSRGHDYIFQAGSIFGHNVVIATLPAGQEYGTGSAAALASQVKTFFPNLWFALLVGVAAGLPNLSSNPARDIRLGDVLVALPEGGSAGLIGYDLGKVTGENGFQPLRLGHALATTETIVRSAIGSIKLRVPFDTEGFIPYYEKIQNMQHATGNFRDPGQSNDRLYETSDDGIPREIERPRRPRTQRTRVWYGPIGSGDKLMKNARQRDELRDRYGIIGLEMEAAGTMNRIPVGVIRGVCDYGDEHKNKEWQPYAAAMAAAYAKAILGEIAPKAQHAELQNPAHTKVQVDRRRYRDGPMIRPGQVPSSQKTLKSLAFQVPSLGGEVSVRKPASVTAAEESTKSDWPLYQTERPPLAPRFLERDDTPSVIQSESEAWRTDGRRVPWIVVLYGLAATGKSQMCLKAITENETKFQGIFYVDASNEECAERSYLDISLVCGFQSHWENIGLKEQIRLTRSWLSSQKEPWLLMIDNADEENVHLSRYIPQGGRGTIIITTTDEHMALMGNAFGRIGAMNSTNALDLLMRYKRPEILLDKTEQDAAELLAGDVLGGLPLAIVQAGSYIFNKHCTYTEYHQEFCKSPQVPLSYELTQWPSYHRPIWMTFNLTFNRIQTLPDRGSTHAVELLRILCFLHHEGIEEQLFQKAWSNMKDVPEWSQHRSLLVSYSPRWDTGEIRAGLEILRRYGLLDCSLPPTRQYSMHRLVKIVCQETLSWVDRKKYLFFAISLIATVLSGIKSPLPWINNPSGFQLQKSVLPHIKVCIEDFVKLREENLANYLPDSMAEMFLLYSKACYSTGHYQEAQHIAELLWDGTNHLIGLQAREQIAAGCASQGDYGKAYTYRQDILFARRTLSQASEDINMAMMNLADSSWMVGLRKEALGLSKEVLSRREKELEKIDPRLLRTKRKVAEYLHGTYQRRKALLMREDILADTEARQCSSEVEYLDGLSTISALADSYQWDGQLMRALGLLEEVYGGRQRVLGQEHPDTLSAYDRVLSAKTRLVRTIKAQKEICQQRKQLVSTWTRMLGSEHPYTQEARVNLGHSYSAIRQWDNALEQQIAVLDIRKKKRLGGKYMLKYLSSLGNVANILSKVERFYEALDLRKTAFEAAREHYGAFDRITFRMDHHLTTCYRQIHRPFRPQISVYRRQSILSSQKSHFTEDDPDILATMSLLAADLLQCDKREESIQIRRDLLVKQQSVLGERNRETLSNMKKLALTIAGDSQDASLEAVKLLETVEQIEAELMGEDNAHIYNTRVKLHRIYRIAGLEREADLLEKNIQSPRGIVEHSDDEDEDEGELVIRQQRRERSKKARSQEKKKKVKWWKFWKTSETRRDSLPVPSPKLELIDQGDNSDFLSSELRDIFDNNATNPSSSEKWNGESGSESYDGC
ncbi:hypothetical protein ACKLNR_013390 [Fusarium oxysporum f. sp. zingiberi]